MPTETSSPSGGGAANRLGLALQLCALRYLGFVPRNLSAAPRSAACFVADPLEAKASNSGSTLKWLGQGASGESPGSIKSEGAKLAFLRQLGAPEWDLSDLNPNRRKFLAQVGHGWCRGLWTNAPSGLPWRAQALPACRDHRGSRSTVRLTPPPERTSKPSFACLAYLPRLCDTLSRVLTCTSLLAAH